MNNKFKAGDVVRLKSGGPDMTVTTAGTDSGVPTVWCSWFIGNKQEKGYFPDDAVELAPKFSIS